MIQSFRDIQALPIEPRRESSYTSAYVHSVDRLGGETSVLRGSANGMEAVRQAVHTICHTERFAYRNTPWNAGIELEQFINRSPNYFRARIGNVVKDALKMDDRIVEVHLLRVEVIGPRSVAAWFKIVSVFGPFEYMLDVPLSRSQY